MINIKTGILKTIDKCPLCDKTIKNCKCIKSNYFNLENL